MGYSLGVDLGTTFVGAALVGDAKPEMVTLGGRSVVVPSVVYLGEDGVLLCGEPAARRSVREPERSARAFKRRLGDPIPVRLGDQTRPATELLAALLGEVLRVVTTTEGEAPERVMLTHPANWGRFRLGQLDEVGRAAGLTEILKVSEPEAAACHYARTRALADGRVVAVYDLGGGTFDVTVLRAAADRVEILGVPEGIERLGGVDFDDALFAHIDHESGGALSALDQREPRAAAALAHVRQECVLAKESLSTDRETVVPVFLPDRNFDVRVTRSTFEELIKAHVESTVGALERTLRSARLVPDEVDAVLLVGGSSRIPLVAQMVTEALGRPTVVDTHPKYAVALGAAALLGDLPPLDRAPAPAPAAAPLPVPAAAVPPLPVPPLPVPPLPVPRPGAPIGPGRVEASPDTGRSRAPGPPRLRLLVDGRSIPVPGDRRFVIGRGDDVQLELADPRISRRHALIAATDGVWAYTDTSRNGTFLDGARVTRVDIVRPIALLLGDAANGTRIELTPETAPGDGRPGRHSAATAVHRLATDRLRIGRAPENDVVLDDILVSRRHAELHRTRGGWTVVDVGSGNGTFVNRRRISGTTPVTPADVIRVGHSALQIDGDRLVECPDGEPSGHSERLGDRGWRGSAR